MSLLKVNELQNVAGTSLLSSSGNTISGTLSSQSGFKNRIINGDMRIDQRNGGASSTAISVYTIDRWFYNTSVASKGTWQQNAGAVTPPTGFTHYLGFTSSSAYTLGSTDEFGFQQIVEGVNVADLAWGTANAQSVTISFWVRSSLTGNFGGSVRNRTVTRSYPFTYNISAANTWQYKTITIPGDTTGTWNKDTSAGLYLKFAFGVGASRSGTSGVWAATNYASSTGSVSVVGTNGATFYITGVQLEKGSVATPFEFRNFAQELMMCQRYFEILEIGPDYNNNSNTWATYIIRSYPLMVEKRTNATTTIDGLQYFNAGAGTNFTPTSMNNPYKYLSFANNALTNCGGISSGSFRINAEL